MTVYEHLLYSARCAQSAEALDAVLRAARDLRDGDPQIRGGDPQISRVEYATVRAAGRAAVRYWRPALRRSGHGA